MAFGEMWIEVAKQRADDLRDEGRRVGRRAGRKRRTQPADGRSPSVLHARTGQLVHWLQHGQIGTGIDVSDGPVTARGRCA